MENLIEQTTAYKIFCREAEAGRLAHAYMIAFEDTACLSEALTVFALRFFGTDRTQKLGGRIVRGAYPDCRFYPEQGKKFNAEAAVALIEDSAMRPSEGDRKLYVISSFEECSAVVQNKLLKVIEEPPEGVSFILGASTLSPVLPTIISRVRLLEIPPFTEGQIAAALERANPGGKYNAMAAASCGGVYGTALALAQGQLEEIRTAAEEILSAKTASAAGLVSMKYAESKFKRQVVAEVQRICFSAARAAAGGKRPDSDEKVAAGWQLPALLRGAEIYGKALRDIKFNAYFSALLYSAMLAMIEENNKWLKLSE